MSRSMTNALPLPLLLSVRWCRSVRRARVLPCANARQYLGLEFVLVWTAVLLKNRVAVSERCAELHALARRAADTCSVQVLCEDVPTLLQCARAIPALAWLVSVTRASPAMSLTEELAQV